MDWKALSLRPRRMRDKENGVVGLRLASYHPSASATWLWAVYLCLRVDFAGKRLAGRRTDYIGSKYRRRLLWCFPVLVVVQEFRAKVEWLHEGIVEPVTEEGGK